MDWHKHWQTSPQRHTGTDHLSQVERTRKGKPITAEQFDAIVCDVLRHLQLTPEDRVLDLCCGNGLITERLAEHCREVVGVDYSAPLLRVAREHHMPANVSYKECDVLKLPGSDDEAMRRFDKVLMYGGLQYFRRADFPAIVDLFNKVSSSSAVFLMIGVPDRDRLWRFYSTLRWKIDFIVRTLRGREAIGTWWRAAEIVRVCEKAGLKARAYAQSDGLDTAHYRFDVRVWRSAAAGGRPAERDVMRDCTSASALGEGA